MKKYFESMSLSIFWISLFLFTISIIGLGLMENIRNSNLYLAVIEIRKLEVASYQLIEDCTANYKGPPYGYEKIRDLCSEDYFDKDFEELELYYDKQVKRINDIPKNNLPWNRFISWIQDST